MSPHIPAMVVIGAAGVRGMGLLLHFPLKRWEQYLWLFVAAAYALVVFVS